MLHLLNYFKTWLIVIIAITNLSLTACSQVIENSQATQVPQLVQAILSDPKTFNPVLSSDATSSSVGSMILEGLIKENPITGENEPALAESWEISEDKLSIIFTLKPGLKWSDGHPLTAEDVVFSYNQLYLNEAIPTGARDVIRIGQSGALPKVRKLNDLQVEFTIPEPFAPFLGSTSLSILPAHILKETVEKKDQNGNPVFLSTWSVDTPPEKIVASGAYKLKSYATSQRIVFEKNPNYWQKDEQGNQLPYIQKVIWEIVESTDTSLLQFRSGGLDSMSISPDYFSLLKKEENRGNFTIYNGGPDYGTNFIAFNLNKGTKEGKPLVGVNKSRWFNDVKFRQAISYAIDRQRMVNNIYRGLGEPQTSPISVQSPYYYQGLQGYTYNPDKAKQLLQEAGFQYNNQQELLDADGNRVRFNLNTNAGNKIREAMGSQIKEDLGKIGIKVDFSPIAFNVLVDRLDNSLEWECILLGLTGGNEPNNGANIWFTDGNLHMFNQDKPGIEGRKVADWETEISQLFIKGARELDEAKRKEIYAEIQKKAEYYLPFIYLVNPLALGAVRNNIQPIQYSALGGAFWNLEELKITE
ncbi:extracellular solute-binding protein family 5 [Stanieria cyanosphaera PCC 7437]|uniref:Extracellular solute-binding protein family 5 n=1 Tax=Stanieria cyanosphaera (strain ATCC 29371 / PCC 7437) TaxID=111780 RepID=K9XYS4_STAC7|nr:ABC transporter substrate-binding protein [Stanieria cyanosphaera]AFZ36827.1 extracellular solute-binding protein family 5 [Stanieria cyanosphaera PCC 7437]